MRLNLQETGDLVTFTEEMFDLKLHFFFSSGCSTRNVFKKGHVTDILLKFL